MEKEKKSAVRLTSNMTALFASTIYTGTQLFCILFSSNFYPNDLYSFLHSSPFSDFYANDLHPFSSIPFSDLYANDLYIFGHSFLFLTFMQVVCSLMAYFLFSVLYKWFAFFLQPLFFFFIQIWADLFVYLPVICIQACNLFLVHL